ncbi:MAG TPA: isoprenylcysteine carboxylmethyltransferase family protein [Rhizomicrobium sp.]|jgi:methyltransferase|nr:isoprenylcysteine carboxylmethyltransferase family protein [Rhizomicrobium sp.]
MIWALAIVGLVALQRLAEVPYAARNTKRLLASGAMEYGRKHYPLFIVLHASWLLAIVVFLPPDPPIYLVPLTAYVVLEVLRVWVMLSLGPYWTTRVISLPKAPLVRKGPYRFLRHPNYWIVVGEVALLPLVFGEVIVCIVFSLLNGALLFWRIRVENAALAGRSGA